MIEESPSFGYWTVAGLLSFNKNTVRRIFQIKGWQVKKRAIGFRPRIQTLPSVASMPNERWSTDLCRILAGRNGWATLAMVMDCRTRELFGWHLSRNGKATTGSSALEHALIAWFETLQHASRIIGDWIRFYNYRRPHQALNMRTPAAAFAPGCRICISRLS